MADLVDGAAHAHDADVLEAVVRSFAARHDLEVVTFVAAPEQADPNETTADRGLRAVEVRVDEA